MALVGQERSLLSEIIDGLQLIYDQRIYASRGHSSLFAYLVKDLGYSEAPAYRRANAVKMVKEIPAIADQVKSGDLNLNTLADAASAFRRKEKEQGEKMSSTEKTKTLNSLVGKSKREAEKELAKSFPQVKEPKTSQRQLTTKGDSKVKTKLSLILSEEQMKVITRLKELYPRKDLAEILIEAGASLLKKGDPMEKAKRAIIKRNLKRESTSKLPNKRRPFSPGKIEIDKITSRKTSVVPAAIKHEVWVRDGGKCQFKDSVTGRTCGSSVSVQMDHLKPRAWGGQHSTQNIELCCKTHNLYRAKKLLGDSVMKAYWK